MNTYPGAKVCERVCIFPASHGDTDFQGKQVRVVAVARKQKRGMKLRACLEKVQEMLNALLDPGLLNV